MSDMEKYGDHVWDRFFELLFPCDDFVNAEEVQADLQRAGIDMRRAYSHLQQLIDSKRAQQDLANAKASRVKLTERLRSIASPKVENLRTSLDEFISRNFSGQSQVAHFHKLQKAATEEDLQSLFDDLNRLASLEKLKDSDERST